MLTEEKSEQLFKSVRSVYIALAAYVNKVGEEIGMDKALDLLSKSFSEIGGYQGKKLKKKTNLDNANASEAYELIKQVPLSLGINLMIPKNEANKLKTRLDKCPIFESAKVVGIYPESFCDNTAVPYYDAVAKQLNSELEFQRTKIKSSEIDFCEEQLILKK
ncbi:MAG: L-2-amino-thiazoline-4-carboxylic acid hydrolase [Promethearchaeota archaeon]